MNIASRVDSYISNRKGEVKSSVGLLECYECEENDFKLNKLWSKSFASQVSLYKILVHKRFMYLGYMSLLGSFVLSNLCRVKN